MFLVDYELNDWAAHGGLSPYDPDCTNANSVDLRWSGRYKLASPYGWSELAEVDTLVVEPSRLYLLDTLEYLVIPADCVGLLYLKSSLGRAGLEHLHAGFFDSGFEGTATLEVHNLAPWPIVLKREQRIVQISLAQLRTTPGMTYALRGKYAGQREPTEAVGIVTVLQQRDP